MSVHHHTPGWLAVRHGNAPLIVSFPHTGTEIPQDIESGSCHRGSRARMRTTGWMC